MDRYPVGTLLVAKPSHPIRTIGKGDGVAVITNDSGTDFQEIYWVNGDPRKPGINHDVVAARWVDTWFDIIPDDQRNNYLPDGFEMPPSFEAFLDLD